MEKEKNEFVEWVKAHKKQLILAGVGITAIIAAIILAKNWSEVSKLWEELEKALSRNDVGDKGSTFTDLSDMFDPVVTSEVVSKTSIVEKSTCATEKIPFDVQKHIRNLHEGYHPSAEKIATAAENGIDLLDNQTWVKTYTKGLDAAA